MQFKLVQICGLFVIPFILGLFSGLLEKSRKFGQLVGGVPPLLLALYTLARQHGPNDFNLFFGLFIFIFIGMCLGWVGSIIGRKI